MSISYKKPPKINIDPYYCETKNYEGKFTLTFYADNKIVNIKMSRWWVGFFADHLHKIIDDEQKKINSLKAKMRGE